MASGAAKNKKLMKSAFSPKNDVQLIGNGDSYK